MMHTLLTSHHLPFDFVSLSSSLAPAMAFGQSTTPSFFNFLKEGRLLPIHNQSLFASVFSMIVASTCLLLLVNHVTIQPLTDEIVLNAKVLNSTVSALHQLTLIRRRARL